MALARRQVQELAPAPPLSRVARLDRGSLGAAWAEQDAPADAALFAPPSLPEAWARQDAAAAEILVLHRRPGGAAFGGQSCECGGRWRYVVAGSDAHPVWRCLHCGGLFRDARRLS